ncbi:MAG: tetratricopeptide repeat protein [Methanomicrobiales archaeon]|nr:tetratricopeptide repeat protein [Methanomicrobiales archaeon]
MAWRIFPSADTTPSRFVNDGIELCNQKKYEDAIVCFTRALEIDPNSAVASIAWGRKGNCLVNLKQYEEAVQCYDRSLEINPQFSNIWFIKGFVLDSLGRTNDAIYCYERAIEINPDYSLAWKAKGDILFAQGRFEEADQCYARAIELNHELAPKVASSRNICAQFIRKDVPATTPPHDSPLAETKPATEPAGGFPGTTEVQLYEETIRKFLGDIEKSQLRLVRQTVARDISELQQQIGTGKEMVQELMEISLKQQELIGKMNIILDLQSSFIERLMEEKEKP